MPMLKPSPEGDAAKRLGWTPSPGELVLYCDEYGSWIGSVLRSKPSTFAEVARRDGRDARVFYVQRSGDPLEGEPELEPGDPAYEWAKASGLLDLPPRNFSYIPIEASIDYLWPAP